MNAAEIPGVGALPVLLAYHINLLRDRHEAAWLAGRRPRIEDVLTLEASRGGRSCYGSCWPPSWRPAGAGRGAGPPGYRDRFPATPR